MSVRRGAVLMTLCALGACDALEGVGTGEAVPGLLPEVPESVVAIAAPYQDLQAVRVLPEDGCYWYRHSGPVETTWLPLRTARGNPICAQPQTG